MAIDYTPGALTNFSSKPEMAKLQGTVSTKQKNFSQMPVDDHNKNIIDDVMNSYEASQTSVQETQEACVKHQY